MSYHEVAGYQSVAQLIKARQTDLGKSDYEVAVALGYEQENIIAMIKRGTMRLPLNRVIEMAGVLEVDALQLLRFVLHESDPGLLNAIERVIGPMVLSQGEIRLIEAVRKVAKGREAVPMVLDRNSLVALVVA